jgi:Deacetylase PdaC
MRLLMSMHSNSPRKFSWFMSIAVLAAALSMAACKKDKDTPAPSPPDATADTPAQPQPAPVELKDVIEQDARYIIGISYPPAARKYPGLAQELQRYAEGARAELLKAVQAVDSAKRTSPYDLTLNFTLIAETPELVAVAADGAVFTGGAHGAPLVARFVWLPQQSKLLTANDLFPDAKAWTTISDYAREQLHASLSQRVDADELPAAERADVMRSVGRMIDEGTEPAPASFAAFEPVLAPEGDKLMGLRFVFPPYQVGPYVDGVRTVEVPTAVLMPYLAPGYRAMFVAAKPMQTPAAEAIGPQPGQ